MNRSIGGPLVAAVSAALLSALLVRAAPPSAPGTLGLPLTSAFSYQGQLLRSGVPYTGSCDFEFRLFDAETGGVQVSSPVVRPGLPVSGGLFSTLLDFGISPFSGHARFLEVAVKCADDPSMVTLLPRTALTPTPYALFSLTAANALSATNAITATAALHAVAAQSATSALTATTALSATSAVSSTTAASATTASTATLAHTATHALSATAALTASSAPYAGLSGVPSSLMSLSAPSPCSLGHVPKWTGSTWDCQPDLNTTYSAGTGLLLSGTQFSVVAPPRPTIARTLLDGHTSSVGEWPSIALGVDGLALISYYDRTNGDLKVAHCEDIACSTATISTLDGATSDVGQFSSITIGPDGLGIISYYDVSNSALKVAHCHNLRCTSATVTTLDNSGVTGQYTTITVMKDDDENGNGQVVIAYYDASLTRLKIIQCQDAACTTFSPSPDSAVVDGTGVGQWATTVTFPGTGLPFVFSKKTSAPAGIRYFACQSAVTCASAGATGDIDSSGTAFSELAATILATGRPLLVARNEGVNRLDLFRCANDSCSTANQFSGPSGGRMPSVTVLPTGQPLIFYVHSTTTQLRGLLCTDFDCSGTRLTIEDIGRVPSASSAWHTAVAIGADGHPLFVYWDNVTTALHVIHATNPFGTPGYRRR